MSVTNFQHLKNSFCTSLLFKSTSLLLATNSFKKMHGMDNMGVDCFVHSQVQVQQPRSLSYTDLMHGSILELSHQLLHQLLFFLSSLKQILKGASPSKLGALLRAKTSRNLLCSKIVIVGLRFPTTILGTGFSDFYITVAANVFNGFLFSFPFTFS